MRKLQRLSQRKEQGRTSDLRPAQLRITSWLPWRGPFLFDAELSERFLQAKC